MHRRGEGDEWCVRSVVVHGRDEGDEWCVVCGRGEGDEWQRRSDTAELYKLN